MIMTVHAADQYFLYLYNKYILTTNNIYLDLFVFLDFLTYLCTKLRSDDILVCL